MDIGELLKLQDDLQRASYANGSPIALDEDERIEFIRWNVLALEDELHEMLGECGWKPWATSSHVNEDAAFGELVDALHFFMNLLLVVAPSSVALTGGPEAVGRLLEQRYVAKREKNARRQEEGYDGLNKCVECKRALDDVVLDIQDDGAHCPCGALVPQ